MPVQDAVALPAEERAVSEAARESIPDEFETLAAAEKWQELLALSESRSALEGSSGLEARLWWVRSQLALKTVPASILAAPLESATKTLVGQEAGLLAGLDEQQRRRIIVLASSVLQETGKALSRGHETDVAISLLERAFLLDGGGSTALRRVLNEEIARRRKVLTRFSSDEEREALGKLQSLRSKLPDSGFVLGAEGGAGLAAETAAAGQETRSSNARSLAILFLIVLIAAGGMVYLGSFAGTAVVRSEAAAFEVMEDKLVQGRSPARMLVPVMPRLSGMGHLDAVFYELKGSAAAEPQPAAVTSVAAAPVPAAVKAPAAGRKETVNTDYPLESELGRKQPDVQSQDVPRAGGVARQSAQRLQRGDDQEPDEAAPVEVEKFVVPRNYMISRHAEVRSKPSLFAAVIDSLAPGDKVKVDGRVGKWLVLRSQRGRLGYISSRDAEESRR